MYLISSLAMLYIFSIPIYTALNPFLPFYILALTVNMQMIPCIFTFPGQATYTCVPLSPSSIIWYRPIGMISLAGKVTAGLVESNDSLPPGL